VRFAQTLLDRLDVAPKTEFAGVPRVARKHAPDARQQNSEAASDELAVESQATRVVRPSERRNCA